MPCASMRRCTRAAASSSSTAGRMRGAMSTMVRLRHRWRMPSAHFVPMSPAPTISTRLSGVSAAARACASSSVRKENFFSTWSRPAMGGTKGREPVATSSLS